MPFPNLKIAYSSNGDEIRAKGLPQIVENLSHNSVSLLGFAAKLTAYILPNRKKEKEKRKKENHNKWAVLSLRGWNQPRFWDLLTSIIILLMSSPLTFDPTCHGCIWTSTRLALKWLKMYLAALMLFLVFFGESIYIYFFSFFLWMTSQVICHKDFVDISLANKANIFSRAVSIFLFFLFSKSQEHQLLQWFWVSFEIKLPISQVSDLGEEMWNFEPIFFPFSSLILA